MAAGHLPEDLMVDILSRLPAKSLLRFRCVHKTWCSLFKSSYFVTTHTQNPNNKGLGFILLPIYDLGNRFCLRLLGPHFFNYRTTSDYILPFEGSDFDLFGSCNGLVCLANSSDVVLYNPSLKQHKILPQSNCPFDKNFMVFGFGYDSRNNDYKVVREQRFLGLHAGWRHIGNESRQICRRLTQVFTLKTNSWREVGSSNIPHGIILSIENTEQCFFNGAIHRLALALETRTAHDVLVSFDVCNEEYKLLPQPNWSTRSHRRINVYRDLLCIVDDVSQRDQLCYDIWVMKEYGVEGSWIQLHSIEVSPRIYCFDPRGLLGFGMNGELIIFEGGWSQKAINVRYHNNESINSFIFGMCECVCRLGAVACGESLVSIE